MAGTRPDIDSRAVASAPRPRRTGRMVGDVQGPDTSASRPARAGQAFDRTTRAADAQNDASFHGSGSEAIRTDQEGAFPSPRGILPKLRINRFGAWIVGRPPVSRFPLISRLLGWYGRVANSFHRRSASSGRTHLLLENSAC